MINNLLKPFVNESSSHQKVRSLQQTDKPQQYTISLLLETSKVLYIRVPETLLYGFGFEEPSLVYSTRIGKVEVIADVSEPKVVEFLDF
jgi:hypothetical protein